MAVPQMILINPAPLGRYPRKAQRLYLFRADRVSGRHRYHNIGVTRTAEDRGRASSSGGTYHAATANGGAFKTPALRNVRLTAPCMHNGSLNSITEVLDFYANKNGIQIQNAEIDREVANGRTGVGGGGLNEVRDFLEGGLTDFRVEHELAPFDHPALEIPDGPNLHATGRTGDGAPCP